MPADEGHQPLADCAQLLDGTPTSNDIGDAFNKGRAMVVGGGALTIHPFGLLGHQNPIYSVEQSGSFFARAKPEGSRSFFCLQSRYPKLLGTRVTVLGQILGRVLS